MLTIETALRLIVIGQELLLVTVLLRGAGDRAIRTSGALLMLCIIGYLVMSDATIRAAFPGLTPAAALFSMYVSLALWLFARAIFETPWPRAALLVGIGLVPLVAWVTYVAQGVVGQSIATVASDSRYVVSLLVVAHAVWLAARGRPDDLVENRRSFRLFFVVVVAIQVMLVLLLELTLGNAAAPAWLELANVLVIAILTTGLALPWLKLDPDFFELSPKAKNDGEGSEARELSAVEKILHRKLEEAMAAGHYRQTGLTISTLANYLNYPEHQLRRLINSRLGYRNFSAFLNSHRIGEARNRLANPELARLPVLTIALDLGYASIGPFNRAFKMHTGVTPTEFRQKHMRSEPVDFE